MVLALSRAFDRAGNSIEAKIAMIAMTTRSSINVKNIIVDMNWGRF